MSKDKPLITTAIYKSTRDLARILSAQRGESMVALLDRLVADEARRVAQKVKTK